MNINFNKGAFSVHNGLKKSNRSLTKSTERLATGYKINRASDDPSGFAIARRLKAQIAGLDTANDNSTNAISVVQIAEGALNEVQSILQRINEVSVQTSTGTLTDSDRENADLEIQQLKKEITQISESTHFNGKGLLDGTFSPKGYADNIGVAVGRYSDEVSVGEYTIHVTQARTVDITGNVTKELKVVLPADSGFPTDRQNIAIEGNKVTITASGGFEMSFMVADDIVTTPPTVPSLAPSATVPVIVNLDIPGIGGMRTQVGSNEGDILDIKIPKVDLFEMGIEDLSVTTAENALKAIDSTAIAQSFVSEVRATLGAYQNRLEGKTKTLDISVENLTASYSSIKDVDMAKEMTEYTNAQIMVQAGMSILAQANEQPQQLLQLLQ